MIIHICDLCGKDVTELAQFDFTIRHSPESADLTEFSLLRLPQRLRIYQICEECGERITTVISTASPITTTPVGAAVVPEVP